MNLRASCLLTLIFRWCTAQYVPLQLPYHESLERYQNRVFVNLTENICKDATIKLWHAERIQETYKHSISYDLGTIAAGIQDTFRHMLQIYQKYSNMSEFRLNKYTMEEILEAYHIIKGDYNELRMEKNLYYEVLDRYQKRQNTDKKASQDTFSKYKKNKNALRRKDLREESYKKSLRYKAWNKRWENYRPEIEGIDIDLD